MNGSRSAATSGGRTALMTAITAATRNAAPGRSRATPGTQAGRDVQRRRRDDPGDSSRSGRSRGLAGSHVTSAPYDGVVTARS